MDKLAALREPLKYKLQAAIMLVSLQNSYEPLIAAIESRLDKDFTFEFVKSELREEHKRRKNNQVSNGDSETSMKANFQTYKSLEKFRLFKQTCFFCERIGDSKPECKKFVE